MKRYLPFLIILAVAAGAIGSGFGFYRTKKREQRLTSNAKFKTAEGAEHSKGAANAPVMLVEFGDFQCPPCGKISEPLNELAREIPQMRLVFRQLPLAMHAHAREAAYAAEAAALQGRFWEMHDLLFREQAQWSNAADVAPLFESYAAKLGLKVERFHADKTSKAVKERVETDEKLAEREKIESTPTLFINDQLVPPSSLNLGALKSLIQQALRKRS